MTKKRKNTTVRTTAKRRKRVPRRQLRNLLQVIRQSTMPAPERDLLIEELNEQT